MKIVKQVFLWYVAIELTFGVFMWCGGWRWYVNTIQYLASR